MLLFDRAYCDYDWFTILMARPLNFVTRVEDNASWVSLETRPVPAGSDGRKDKIVFFTKQAIDDDQTFFRQVVWWEEAHQREFASFTDHFHLDAATVAVVYRERWKLELLLKVLKKHLRIKTFVRTSANALKIHIWTALIALLLVRYLQLRSRPQWHLNRFLALLRHQRIRLPVPLAVPRQPA